MGRCVKRRVLAVAFVDGEVLIGENGVENEQEVCPRKDMKTGEGWELCKSVCAQSGHAEIDLIKKADGNLKGANVVIFNHYWVCDSCRKALEEANVGEVIFG